MVHTLPFQETTSRSSRGLGGIADFEHPIKTMAGS